MSVTISPPHYTQLASEHLDKVVQAVEVCRLDYAGDELVTRGGGAPVLGGGQPVEMVGAQARFRSDAHLIDKHWSGSGQAVSSAENVLRATEMREQAGN